MAFHCILKLHKPIILESLHYFEINIPHILPYSLVWINVDVK